MCARRRPNGPSLRLSGSLEGSAIPLMGDLSRRKQIYDLVPPACHRYANLRRSCRTEGRSHRMSRHITTPMPILGITSNRTTFSTVLPPFCEGRRSGCGSVTERASRFAPCRARGNLGTRQLSYIPCRTTVSRRRDSHDLAPPSFALFGFCPHHDIHHGSSFTDPRFVTQLTR